jgi:hypothetical protein
MACHTPTQVPERYEQLNLHIQTEARRKYAAMFTAMDEGIGNVTDALKRKGLWDNTLVVAFSDNGGLTRQGASNHPLRGMKMGPFEGGVRVVSFLSGGADLGSVLPGAARGGYFNGMMSVCDLHTLLTDVAGADKRAVTANSNKRPLPLDAVMDGEGMLARIIESSVDTATKPQPTGCPVPWEVHASPRSEVVLMLDPVGQYEILNQRRMNGAPRWSMPGSCNAIRVGRWKLIEGMPGMDDWYGPDPTEGFENLGDTGAVKAGAENVEEGDYGYRTATTIHGLKRLWLFDLEADETEHVDVKAAHPEVVAELRAKLAAYEVEAVEPFADRWDTITGMMEHVHHKVLSSDVANNQPYVRALWAWQEPEHMAETRFFDKARNWIVSRAGGAFQRALLGPTDKKTLLPVPTAAGVASSIDDSEQSFSQTEWTELEAELRAVERTYLAMPRYREALALRPGHARL